MGTTDRDYASKEWLEQPTPFVVRFMDGVLLAIGCGFLAALVLAALGLA